MHYLQGAFSFLGGWGGFLTKIFLLREIDIRVLFCVGQISDIALIKRIVFEIMCDIIKTMLMQDRKSNRKFW